MLLAGSMVKLWYRCRFKRKMHGFIRNHYAY